MVDFGDRLKELRKQIGLNQAELAEKMSVTKSVISYYENRERAPSPEILIKLASIFHVSTDYLLGLENEQVLNVSDLNKEDIELLQHTLEALKNKNNN